MTWPITFGDVLDAHDRIAPHLAPTLLRHYPELDAVIGAHVLVKHEDQNPTHSFKVRNGLSALSVLPRDTPGVVAATRGNHGLGVSWAAKELGIPATICVPVGNSPLKNARIEELGARLVSEGKDYDESVEVMQRLVRDERLVEIHSTNNRHVIAGAATLTLEIAEHASEIDHMVVAVGGGSHAVGAMTVLRERFPDAKVYGVQAERASAIHDSWHAGEPLEKESADTFADGLATRRTYDLTFPALRDGLADFLTVTESEIADAIRLFSGITGITPEGAGPAGLAGLRKVGLSGTVAIVITGSNIDPGVLDRL